MVFLLQQPNALKQGSSKVYFRGAGMARFKISKRNGWFWAQHSTDPEFCRSQTERVRKKDHTLAICYSAAREKWVGGGDSDEFLREKFPGCKTTSGVR